MVPTDLRSPLLLTTAFVFVLMGCTGGQPPPQIAVVTVEVSKEVTREVTRDVEVTREVEVTRIVEVTREVVITATPLPATPTPTETPTPVPAPKPLGDTAPDTILEVGETWKQAGAEVTLKNAKLHAETAGSGVLFELFFTNHKPQDISIGYSVDSFTAVDNRGRSLRVGYFVTGGFGYQTCSPQTKVMPTDQTIRLECFGRQTLMAEVDPANTAITEIIVTVSGISTIENARWRIPIYH